MPMIKKNFRTLILSSVVGITCALTSMCVPTSLDFQELYFFDSGLDRALRADPGLTAVEEVFSEWKQKKRYEFGPHSLLTYAAKTGRADIVSELVKRGTAPDAIPPGFLASQKLTPLHLAIMNGEVRVVHVLIAAGCAVNYQTQDGSTSLWDVAVQTYTNLQRAHHRLADVYDILELLFEAGAPITMEENMDTHWQQWSTNRRCLEELLKNLNRGYGLWRNPNQNLDLSTPVPCLQEEVRALFLERLQLAERPQRLDVLCALSIAKSRGQKPSPFLPEVNILQLDEFQSGIVGDVVSKSFPNLRVVVAQLEAGTYGELEPTHPLIRSVQESTALLNRLCGNVNHESQEMPNHEWNVSRF